jgi:hypothetical protein
MFVSIMQYRESRCLVPRRPFARLCPFVESGDDFVERHATPALLLCHLLVDRNHGDAQAFPSTSFAVRSPARRLGWAMPVLSKSNASTVAAEKFVTQ